MPMTAASTTPVPGSVNGGVTSVALDTATLSTAAGLNLSGTNGTVQPASSQFNAGFAISPRSSFQYDSVTGAPLSGSIEHTGTVSFATDALGTVTVGNFSVGFDPARKSDKASGFYVQDTAGTGAILFDVSNPGSLNASASSWNVSGADLLVSPEFNGFLNSRGLASTNLTGADVGDVAIAGISSSSALNPMMPQAHGCY
jgi:hypothetical protein